MRIEPGRGVLGATVHGLDASQPLTGEQTWRLAAALGRYGVLCIPGQELAPASLRRFGASFGELEVNVAGAFQDPVHPEVMTLSNMLDPQGRPLGARDAGQGWHTDMSYSERVAFSNILHALRVPRRGGRPLGATQFRNMALAYRDLPGSFKDDHRGTRVVHDYEKFWEEMRAKPGSNRPPLTDEQRRRKPPVEQSLFAVHPVTGEPVLYCNPGYATRVVGMSDSDSRELLEYVFAHQGQDRYLHQHDWREGDVLMWDNILTTHQAVADYGDDEPRWMIRVQVMAPATWRPAAPADEALALAP